MISRVIAILLTGSCLTMSAQAQTPDTLWLTREGYVADQRDSAAYFRLATAAENGLFHTRDYRLNGTLAQTATGTSPLLTIREGAFVAYDSTGHKVIEANYRRGLPDGLLRRYFKNTDRLAAELHYNHGKREGEAKFYDSATGKIWIEGLYKDDKAHDVWARFFPGSDTLEATTSYAEGQWDGPRKVYYRSGILKRNDVYRQGKLESGKLYNLAGREMPYFPELPEDYTLRNATYNTMLWGLEKIAHNRAFERYAGQRIRIRFVVGRSGTIRQEEIVSGPGDKVLRREILEVMRSAPDAKPYKVNDRPEELLFDGIFEMGDSYRLNFRSRLVRADVAAIPETDLPD